MQGAGTYLIIIYLINVFLFNNILIIVYMLENRGKGTLWRKKKFELLIQSCSTIFEL